MWALRSACEGSACVRRVRGSMGTTFALCCEGRGGAVQGSAEPWLVPVWGSRRAVVWASGQGAPPLGRPGLASGSVDPLG